MAELCITFTEVVIHPPGDLLATDALILRLAPDGDYLELHQGSNEIDLDLADLQVLLDQGRLLMKQSQ